ncbi:MAG TPA: type II secretion system protein GspM [Steroidobacteraceae bacterium]|nr:type II secretion system protein GspM [Steroidobacteraceae bacterium]
MNADILTRYRALSSREQRMVQLVAAALALALLYTVFVPLDGSVARARARVLHKQQDLAWMQGVAPQLAAAAPVAPPPSSQRSLIAVIDSSARESGLGSALATSEPSGADGLRVTLNQASFDTLVAWLARLSQQNGIHVESATIDGTRTPGVVNAGIVLRTASAD